MTSKIVESKRVWIKETESGVRTELIARFAFFLDDLIDIEEFLDNDTFEEITDDKVCISLEGRPPIIILGNFDQLFEQWNNYVNGHSKKGKK